MQTSNSEGSILQRAGGAYFKERREHTSKSVGANFKERERKRGFIFSWQPIVLAERLRKSKQGCFSDILLSYRRKRCHTVLIRLVRASRKGPHVRMLLLISWYAGETTIVRFPGHPVIKVGVSVQVIIPKTIGADIPVFYFPEGTVIKVYICIRL